MAVQFSYSMTHMSCSWRLSFSTSKAVGLEQMKTEENIWKQWLCYYSTRILISGKTKSTIRAINAYNGVFKSEKLVGWWFTNATKSYCIYFLALIESIHILNFFFFFWCNYMTCVESEIVFCYAEDNAAYNYSDWKQKIEGFIFFFFFSQATYEHF